MIDKERAKLNPKVQWTKFVCVLVLYLLFLYWVGSWWGLLVVPFIYDVYITKRIHWQWWKDAERPVRFIMSWVDALVFALVAVYFINLPELRHTLVIARKVVTHRRLSVCKQDELWPADSRDTAHNAAHTAHHATDQHEIVSRLATLGLSTSERFGTREAQ